MKKLIIKKLALINFKGIRNLTIDFDEKETSIYGDNATGKTTVADGFNWLPTGKDSHAHKDFEVKTLDKENRAIPKIDHEVEGVFDFDGETITAKRVLREKWTKKRGSLEAEFTGNVTEYYWNDVPLKQNEFQAKIADIVSDDIFPLISNPFAFNSLHWQKRRAIIEEMAGLPSDIELAQGNEEYKALFTKLDGKSLEDYKKQLKASILKAKKDIQSLPDRIDEVERSKPESHDFKALKEELEGKQTELSGINAKLDDANKAFQSKLDEVRDQRVKANNLKSEIEIIEQNARKEAVKRTTPDTSELDGVRSNLTDKEGELKSFENALETILGKEISTKSRIDTIDGYIHSKREEWNRVNSETLTFDDKEFCCPTCDREFDAEDIEAKKAELTDKFNTNKTERLNAINREGKGLAEEKTNLEKELETLKDRIQSGQDKVATCQSEIADLKAKIESTNVEQVEVSEDEVYEGILKADKNYEAKKKELSELQAKIKDVPSPDNSELINKRQEITTAVDEIKSKLANEVLIQKADTRITELADEEKKLAQSIADLEKEQFTIENFEKEKVNRIEESVNGLFKMVRFKMFAEQINGGVSETCEAMVDGVPFSDLNNAGRINAGIDIINALSQFYGVSVPVFIDNRESVTDLIETQAQIVNLVVSKPHKKLTVKTGVKELQEA